MTGAPLSSLKGILMAALDTVAKFVTRARVLLQDTIETYRYSDAELVAALSLAILEARKIRPDLFLQAFIDGDSLQEFTANDSTVVEIDEQYRTAFLYYMVGHAQLRDDEATTDPRAMAFLNKFTSQLLSLA